MKIMSFDLSGKCIGVIAAEVDDEWNVTKIASAPIIPKGFDASTLGFLKTKKKIIKGDSSYSSYIYPGETSVTKIEKKRRDVAVRAAKDVALLAYISDCIDNLMSQIEPDMILVEKNETFNGILTTVLLAKVMGLLHGVAGAHHLPIKEYRVSEVRKNYDLMRMTIDFVKGKTSEELASIPDITKRVIRYLMEEIYDIKFLTDDESDACIVLDYFINEKRAK